MSDTAVTPQIVTEIVSGDALGMGAAARLLPAHRGEGRAHPSCIWRWITTGARAADGRTVRLEAARVAGRWLTSRAALARYIAALTPSTDTPPIPQPTLPRSTTQRRRATEAASRRLIAAGA